MHEGLEPFQDFLAITDCPLAEKQTRETPMPSLQQSSA
jgi:hypothetical protein